MAIPDMADLLGAGRAGVSETVRRLWIEGLLSPETVPGATGRFPTRLWRAGRGIPWRPSPGHRRGLGSLPGPGANTGCVHEDVAVALGVSPRTAKTVLWDLQAAGWAEMLRGATELSDRRRTRNTWRRTIAGEHAAGLSRRAWQSPLSAPTGTAGRV